MAATVIIPARYASTRFPGKMLARETGRPLVQHVVDRVSRCRGIERVIVAADDARIADALRPLGTTVVMTSAAHASGTDRIAEVARTLEAQIIINVQGDEPEIEPMIVQSLAEQMESQGVEMATVATAFPAGADPSDPNLVKVVCDDRGRALYFSRSPIPFHREPAGDSAGGPAYHLHLGIYAYRRDFLLEFAAWSPTPLEQAEKLEQLRALEHGRPIFVLKVDRPTHGIDTPEQYAAFVERYRRSQWSVVSGH